MTLVTDYIKIIDSAYEDAEHGISNLEDEIFFIHGMSGTKTRHFLNNSIDKIGGRYLEIGVWKGSTFCSALNKANNSNFCVAVDNWREFGGPKEEFHNNIQKFINLKTTKVMFVEKDYRNITDDDLLTEKFGKFSVYLYDGPHDFADQYDALNLYINHLNDDFVFLCDDWNWEKDVEAGTRAAIKDLGIVVHKEWVMTTPNRIDNDMKGWWNGYYAAVCSKK